MSSDQYQRSVNSLDKDIADLEKKKAAADKKAADEQGKAARVRFSSNISMSSLKMKMNEKERHEKAARKATEESANLQKKIAEKRNKRNDAYLKLQRELQNERKKEISTQQRVISNMQRSYEERIAKLENQAMPVIHTVTQQTNLLPEYDVFISHASEDKEDFVDEFVAELRKAGIKVWYDTTQILWGDSLRKRIDEGLKKSRFGISVLSPNYIADGKYWTKEELDGIFQMESINGKTLLPIWHNLTKKQVIDFSPIVANRKAMTTAAMTAEEIAQEVVKLICDNAEEG